MLLKGFSSTLHWHSFASSDFFDLVDDSERSRFCGFISIYKIINPNKKYSELAKLYQCKVEKKPLKNITRLDPRGMSPPGRGLPNREASKICEEQLDLNTALGRTRASGFQITKIEKVSDEKRWSPLTALSAHTSLLAV